MSQPSRRKGGLGRGLASLIPTGPAEGETDQSPLGGPRIGARYAFSEMNDRWFGWKNLMSSDRR